MRHAGHYDPLQENDLGITRQAWDQGTPEPPWRMRLHHWVIAAGCLTGAIAAYVAFAATGAPARPMPSPFAPVAHHAVLSRGTANCAAP